jgi:plastocyanin
VIRKHPALLALAIAVVLAALALAACGGDDDDDTTAASESTAETTSTADQASSGGGETIAIGESEYKLDPADPTAKAGTVTFDLTNDGQTEHNLEVEGNGIEEESETIAAGDSTSFSVDLEPGTYEIYCSIDGHKDLGMEGELTVN